MNILKGQPHLALTKKRFYLPFRLLFSLQSGLNKQSGRKVNKNRIWLVNGKAVSLGCSVMYMLNDQ